MNLQYIVSYPEYALVDSCVCVCGGGTSSICLVSFVWIIYVSEFVIYAVQIPIGAFVFSFFFKDHCDLLFCFLPWTGSYFICAVKWIQVLFRACLGHYWTKGGHHLQHDVPSWFFFPQGQFHLGFIILSLLSVLLLIYPLRLTLLDGQQKTTNWKEKLSSPPCALEFMSLLISIIMGNEKVSGICSILKHVQLQK